MSPAAKVILRARPVNQNAQMKAVRAQKWDGLGPLTFTSVGAAAGARGREIDSRDVLEIAEYSRDSPSRQRYMP